MALNLSTSDKLTSISQVLSPVETSHSPHSLNLHQLLGSQNKKYRKASN